MKVSAFDNRLYKLWQKHRGATYYRLREGIYKVPSSIGLCADYTITVCGDSLECDCPANVIFKLACYHIAICAVAEFPVRVGLAFENRESYEFAKKRMKRRLKLYGCGRVELSEEREAAA